MTFPGQQCRKGEGNCVRHWQDVSISEWGNLYNCELGT